MKIRWLLLANLVITFQLIVTCFDFNVLVFLFSEHC